MHAYALGAIGLQAKLTHLAIIISHHKKDLPLAIAIPLDDSTG
jgi:hypothetical protein